MPIQLLSIGRGEAPENSCADCLEQQFPGLGTLTMTVSQIESFQIFVKCNNNVTSNCQMSLKKNSMNLVNCNSTSE